MSSIHKKHLLVQASDGTDVEVVAGDVKRVQHRNPSSAESTLESLTDRCDESGDNCDNVSLRKAAGDFESL